MISVVNKYKHQPTSEDVYIGRGSPLGNPYTSIRDRQTKAESICSTREESIGQYKEWLLELIGVEDKETCDELNRIWLIAKNRDVNLVCFCKPKACHGDVIKEIIDEKINEQARKN